MMSSASFDEQLQVSFPDFEEQNDLRIREYNSLRDVGYKVHASYLFLQSKVHEIPKLCLEVYVTLVLRLPKRHGINPAWMELGCYLGITKDKLNYIYDNHKIACPTDTMLRVFTQDEDATFGKILKSLMDMGRLDVLQNIFDPLKRLFMELNDKQRNNDQDQGYYSNSSRVGGIDILIPNFVENSVIFALKPLEAKSDPSNDSTALIGRYPPKQQGKPKQSSLESQQVPDGPSVMLTYSYDGITIAQNLAEAISNYDNGGNRINVILLENNKRTVSTNAEHYIRNYYEKVDYVMPIITEGYMEVISGHSNVAGGYLNNIDCQYAHFIYTLMLLHYTNVDGCFNLKVRSVLSRKANDATLKKVVTYQLLSLWTHEDEIQTLLAALYTDLKNTPKMKL